MKFGDYIRQKREKNSWTQPEAAARIDIEQSYLSKLETGKSYPSEEVFEKLVKAYDIQIDELGRGIFSGELDKLREIASVRAVVLGRQQNELKLLRGWLIACLAMLMIGSGLVMYEYSQGASIVTHYRYQSPGIIRDGEPILIYQFLAAGNPTPYSDGESGSLTERLAYDVKETTENMGPEFVTKVEGGQRRYQLIDRRPVVVSGIDNLFLALGVSLMVGGITSFFISRRWR